MAADALGAGRLIIERLKTKVPALASVKAGSAIIGAQVNDLATILSMPAAVVYPDAPTYGEGPYDGAVQTEVQPWWVTVVVESVTDPRPDQSTDDTANEAVTGVIRALLGWRPSSHHQSLRLVAREQPEYATDWTQYPLLFETAVILQGDPT